MAIAIVIFPVVVLIKFYTYSATTFAAYLMLGFLQIGREMFVHLFHDLLVFSREYREDPFGCDLNDLSTSTSESLTYETQSVEH